MVSSGISTCLYGAILPEDPYIWGWKLNFNTDTGIWVAPNSPMLVLAAEFVLPNEATCVFVAAAAAAPSRRLDIPALG
jgi:hypothetical protein